MRIKNKALSLAIKIIIAVGGIVGVELSLKLFTDGVNYSMLNFYTNLSNVFVAAYYVCAVVWLIKNYKNDEKVTFCPVFKGMATMVITLTFLVVVFILHMGFTMNNTMGFSLFLLHYFVPILVILDYFLFDKKGSFKKIYPIYWTAPPIVYIVYAMIAARIGDGIGGMGGSRYPYPFLDTDMLGVPAVVGIIAAISVLYIALGFGFYALDKKLAKKAENKE